MERFKTPDIQEKPQFSGSVTSILTLTGMIVGFILSGLMLEDGLTLLENNQILDVNSDIRHAVDNILAAQNEESEFVMKGFFGAAPLGLVGFIAGLTVDLIRHAIKKNFARKKT